jgi:hypothetical protein
MAEQEITQQIEFGAESQSLPSQKKDETPSLLSRFSNFASTITSWISPPAQPAGSQGVSSLADTIENERREQLDFLERIAFEKCKFTSVGTFATYLKFAWEIEPLRGDLAMLTEAERTAAYSALNSFRSTEADFRADSSRAHVRNTAIEALLDDLIPTKGHEVWPWCEP